MDFPVQWDVVIEILGVLLGFVNNIPLDWTFHHTPYGYMDRYGWLKAMNQFSNICGVYPVNNKILFFDGHDINFDKRALTQMQSKNIQPFLLKVDNSINDQPNDNGPNSKLKALYNILKAKWMLKYVTTRFQHHHMNSVLVETWEAFMVSSSNIIRYSFTKTNLLPPYPTQHDNKYTGMCGLCPNLFKRNITEYKDSLWNKSSV